MQRTILATLGAVASATATATNPTFTNVFTAGKEGYACYRIPSLLRLPSTVNNGNTLLAFAEGRKYNCDDHGWNDIVLKASHDLGTTWQPLTVVYGESNSTHDVTIGNPCPLVDSIKNKIVLAYCRNNLEAFTIESTNWGSSWDTATPITLPVPSDWTWVATGPPGGIQITATGHYIIPADHYNKSSFYYSHAYTSDDFGKTYTLSESIPHGNECQAAAMPWVSPSTVLLSMRTDHATRQYSISSDAGSTWGNPVQSIEETQCEASLVALPHHPSGPLLVLSSAFSTKSRENLTLHTSRDSGVTWVPTVQVYANATAYSSIIDLEDGNGNGKSNSNSSGSGSGASVGILFEKDNYELISYTTVALA